MVKCWVTDPEIPQMVAIGIMVQQEMKNRRDGALRADCRAQVKSQV